MKKIIAAVLFLVCVVCLVSCDELDKSELEKAVAIEINASDYTEESYANYKQKYDAAVAELNNTATTEAKINLAARELNAAINSLVRRADFSVLEKILAEVYSPDKYTVESYAEYTEVYKMASDVFANKNSRQSSVNSAVKMLRDTIDSLVPMADTTELEQLLAKDISPDKYTSATYNKYKALYDAAKVLFEKSNDAVSGDQVADLKADIALCVAQLKLSIEQLVLKGSVDRLSEKYSQAMSVYNGSVDGVAAKAYYSEKSYNELGNAINNAKSVIEKNDFDQAYIDKAENQLDNAISGLVVRGERNELFALIVEAQSKYIANFDWFTEDSFNALNDAVNKAIDLYNNNDASTVDLITAISNIEQAIYDLEYVIIIGTGRTDFDFSEMIFAYGENELLISDILTNPSSIINLLSDITDTRIIMFTGDAINGFTAFMADGSTFYIKGNVFTVKSGDPIVVVPDQGDTEPLPPSDDPDGELDDPVEPPAEDTEIPSDNGGDDPVDPDEPEQDPDAPPATEPVDPPAEDTELPPATEPVPEPTPEPVGPLFSINGIFLTSNESDIVAIMGANPTEYSTDGVNTVLKYVDSSNGFTVVFTFNIATQLITDITVTFNSYI